MRGSHSECGLSLATLQPDLAVRPPWRPGCSHVAVMGPSPASVRTWALLQWDRAQLRAQLRAQPDGRRQQGRLMPGTPGLRPLLLEASPPCWCRVVTQTAAGGASKSLALTFHLLSPGCCMRPGTTCAWSPAQWLPAARRPRGSRRASARCEPFRGTDGGLLGGSPVHVVLWGHLGHPTASWQSCPRPGPTTLVWAGGL